MERQPPLAVGPTPDRRAIRGAALIDRHLQLDHLLVAGTQHPSTFHHHQSLAAHQSRAATPCPRHRRTVTAVPVLVLLNGPPASGKSTLAARLVAARPLALDLDVDIVRGMLGSWFDDPTAAGLAARALALDMARTHLRAGHDVVVPQFLGRADFIDQLDGVAHEAGARFVEIALVIGRQEAIEAFHQRREASEERVHLDATALVDRSSSEDPLGEMYDRYAELVERRSTAHRVRVDRGDVDGTVEQIERLLAGH